MVDAIPTPPATVNAPSLALVLAVVADMFTTPPDDIEIASVSDAEPIVPASLIMISSANVTIPVDAIVIAEVELATPIVPPSFISKSSLKVTIPFDASVITSATEALPIVPPSFMSKSSGSVVTFVDESDMITVPDAFGNDIVLSAVGSTTVRVVSLSSFVAPSKTIVPSSVMAKDEPVIAAKVPAAAELAPIVVPSIAPALITTVARVAVPVVERFSSPKLIEPELSVIETAARPNVPAVKVGD